MAAAKESEILFFGEGWCPECAEHKKLLKKAIASGEVKYIDTETDPKAKEYIKKYKVEAIPMYVRVNLKTGKHKKVTLYANDDTGEYMFK